MCSPTVIESALAGLSRREALHLAAGALAGALARPARAAAERPAEGRTIAAGNVLDLTHALSPAFPIWPGNAPLKLTNTATLAKDGYYANRWDVAEHHGTHLDAPAHFAPGGLTAERLGAASLVVPAAVLDLRERARKDADAVVTVDDLKAWEKAHGRLPKGCGVFLCSGWDARAGDAKAFLGQDGSKGLHFPGFSKEAAEFLVKERTIDGVGIDTPSIDHGPSRDFIVHQILNGADLYGLENVANLDKLPTKGATIIALPMKIKGGTGAPVRVIALLP